MTILILKILGSIFCIAYIPIAIWLSWVQPFEQGSKHDRFLLVMACFNFPILGLIGLGLIWFYK